MVGILGHIVEIRLGVRTESAGLSFIKRISEEIPTGGITVPICSSATGKMVYFVSLLDGTWCRLFGFWS